MATPLGVVHLDSVSSTQDEARRRFADEPLLVTAAHQTKGRGRSGASWVNAERALAASLALRLQWPAEARPRITLVAGLAAAEVLAGVGLKWPNDVVVEGGKVGGILVESDGAVAVVGLGVNLWWSRPMAEAASLLAADPGPEEGPRLAVAWAEALLRRLGLGPDSWGRREYLRRCVTVGREITWDPHGRGRAMGVDEHGRLLVETERGVVALDSGEVRHVESQVSGRKSQDPGAIPDTFL